MSLPREETPEQVVGCDKMGTTLMPEEVENKALKQEYRAVEQNYRRDVAILEARPFMERAFFALWTALDLSLLAFFLLIIPFYIVSGSFSDGRMMASVGENAFSTHALSNALKPADLKVGSIKAFSTGSGTYDLFADIENPNDLWNADFRYHLVFDGGESGVEEGFVLPGKKSYVTSLHVSSNGLPRNIRVVFDELHFERIDRHTVPDYAAWLKEREVFPVSQIVYSTNVGLSGAPVGQTDFTLTNRTAYGYFEPKFLVLLERGGSVVAVNEVTITRFASGEERPVNLRWFDAIPSTATIRVVPLINYFDQSLYMEPEE
jgi:hypothetical protein